MCITRTIGLAAVLAGLAFAQAVSAEYPDKPVKRSAPLPDASCSIGTIAARTARGA